MRSIKKIHSSEYRPIADLVTYSPMPTRSLEMLDPFLFLNHHGPQVYGPDNDGLPFGPHPHRGMETVTFILDGDIMHKDSGGHESIIREGGIQWMTAGRGLIHAEVSSDEFMDKGGPLEILQLWINLPAKLKMTEPRYIGLQKDDIPMVSLHNDKVRLQLISGEWKGNQGAFESLSNVFMSTVYFDAGGRLETNIPKDHTIFFYVVRGVVSVNGKRAEARQLVEFDYDGEELEVEAEKDSVVLFGHAKPFKEPVVAQGPFVMNTMDEIYQAYEDYRQGKFGSWHG
jgi:redox-sensitive bicupin YhaK (pirin superfamily)